MPFPASGGAAFAANSKKAIRLAYHGCVNRPFFQLVVMEKHKRRQDHVIEQLGTYDPMPNKYGECISSLNLDRITYWVGEKAEVSKSVMRLFGLSGLFPIHPHCYITAWRNREKLKKNLEEEKQVEAESN